jgi:hypothetical protein
LTVGQDRSAGDAFLFAALGNMWAVGVTEQQSNGDPVSRIACHQPHEFDVLGRE